MSSGKEITPENVKSMIDQLAAKDKEGIVPNLQNIGGLISSTGDTQHTDLINVLGALNALPGAIAGAKNAPPPPDGSKTDTGTTTNTGGKKVNGYASGTLYAPGGRVLVGDGGGPELVDIPSGSRIYSAPQTRGMLADAGSSAGEFVTKLAQAIGSKAGSMEEVAAELADSLANAAGFRMMDGLNKALQES